MRLSVKVESTTIDVFNSKNWNICCCGSEKCALSHGVGVSQGPVHDCTCIEKKRTETEREVVKHTERKAEKKRSRPTSDAVHVLKEKDLH